jgi:thiamine biosynthesis lipoprotein ApbE
MMGTVIQMTALDAPEERAGPALEAAMAEMQRLKALLSEWQPDRDRKSTRLNSSHNPASRMPSSA